MAKNPPDISKMSIAEASAFLTSRTRGMEALLRKLESDQRSGMQRLAAQERKKRKAERSERARLQRMLKHEKSLWKKGFTHIAGVDEVGRGPLAGPVVAAAVILPQNHGIPRLNDSKVLTPDDRDALYLRIQEEAIATATGAIPAEEIDRINIYQATLKAMRIAIAKLGVPPDRVLVDGNRVPESGYSELAIIGGDGASQSIAAASVIAKVTRDREMIEWDKMYPAYGFAKHKGYASEKHTTALAEQGPCPIHRRSFCTVDDALSSWSVPFQEVRECLDNIMRLNELQLYHQSLKPRKPEFAPAEWEEIERRIVRRSDQLKGPGIAGVEAAENWLLLTGYMILERNVRLGRGEIDLIAQQGDTLAFIEVKTLSGEADLLTDRVTRQKQVRIIDAASHYLQKNPTRLAPRFDVMTVRLTDEQPAVTHLKSAFES